MQKDNKIRMVKIDDEHITCFTHEITQIDKLFVQGTGLVEKDAGFYKATIYELIDSEVHSAWADTPRKAVNQVLKEFDLHLGYEVR